MSAEMNKAHTPEITFHGVLSMQVCVPSEWTDEDAKNFADTTEPCGTELGWSVRKDPKLLAGDPERNPCRDRQGCVHIMLDA